MSEPEFLELDVVLLLHDEALRSFGGLPGLKSEAALQSALDRPLNKWGYSDPTGRDLFDIAAAYAFGIASNHAFNDGNKRTAWSCCVLFLKVNGIEVDLRAAEVVEQMVRLATGATDEGEFAVWMRGRARPGLPFREQTG